MRKSPLGGASAARAVGGSAASVTRASVNPGPRAGVAPPPPMRLVPAGPADEVELVRRAQGGDRSAFEQLVRITARMLYARLYVEVGDRQRAEDLVQETYLTAWRSIGQLHDVPDASAFRRWLFAVAKSVRIDSLRHESRKKRAAPRQAGASAAHDDLMADLHDPNPQPDATLEQQEKQEQVLGLLRSLPDEYRLPISMRYLAGAEYETICRQLGLTNGSLRGLLARGMTRLRQLVGVGEEA